MFYGQCYTGNDGQAKQADQYEFSDFFLLHDPDFPLKIKILCPNWKRKGDDREKWRAEWVKPCFYPYILP